MGKKISVIIPVYQAEDTIRRCLNSVVQQTYLNIEVLVIIDGSTDNSESICREFEDNVNFIHVLVQKNRGASAARNLGLKVASGDFVYFMDSDDQLLPNCFEIITKSVQNSDLLVFDFEDFSNSETNFVMQESCQVEVWDKLQTLKRFFNINIGLKKPCYGYLWNKLFKLNIIKKHLIYFDESAMMWEDMLFCCTYLIFAKNVLYLPKVLYKYKDNVLSVSHTLKARGYLNWVITGGKIASVVKANFNFFFEEYMGVYSNIIMEYIIYCKKNHVSFDEKLLRIVTKYQGKLRKKYYFLFTLYRLISFIKVGK